MAQTSSASGDRLRGRRQRSGLTQDQLAAAAGVTTKTVWRYETGAQEGGPAELKIKLALLRIRVEQLAPTPEELADVMGGTIGLAERIINGEQIAPVTLERAHRALDELERRIEAEEAEPTGT